MKARETYSRHMNRVREVEILRSDEQKAAFAYFPAQLKLRNGQLKYKTDSITTKLSNRKK